MKKSKIYITALLLLFALSSYSQWECRSKLGGHLKPFHKKIPLSWAVESTMGHGFMDDRQITNAMLFIGLDYSFKKKHQFYLEVGRKSWRNTLDHPENIDESNSEFFNKVTHGIREGFYRYSASKTNFIAGFHSMNLGDKFLVSERGLGVSYNQKIQDFNVKLTGATVLKDFSRFGTFCSVHYLYNVIYDRHYAYLGEDIGETNFAGAVFSWKPSKKSNNKASNDEFSEFSEFSEPEKRKVFKEAGIVVYNEFGWGIDTMQLHYGLMSNWEMPGKIELDVEALHQYKENNQAVIGFVRAKKQIRWGAKGQTYMHLAYFDKYDIDKGAMACASFSNLFIGEVMRLDVVDMPLYQFAARHRIPKYKLHFKLQSTKQFKNQLVSEYNIAVGKTFWKNLKLTTMLSRMDAISLHKEKYMARLEMRITL